MKTSKLFKCLANQIDITTISQTQKQIIYDCIENKSECAFASRAILHHYFKEDNNSIVPDYSTSGSSQRKSNATNLADKTIDFSLYPTLVENQITINSSKSGILQIFNNLGICILKTQINTGASYIDLSHIISGIYYYNFNNGGINGKIIKD